MRGVFAKLQWKNVDPILVVDAPDEFAPVLAELAGVAGVDRVPGPGATYDFAIVFVRTCADVARHAAPIVEKMNPDAVLWFAYPKKSSKKFKSDISRDEGWAPLGELGFEGVRQVAIDEDWSALRFRQARYINTMARNQRLAMSEEGRARTG